MQYRNLGDSLRVSAVGLGCSPLSGTPLGDYGRIPEDEVAAILGRAIDLGITLLDSAEVYGPWLSEEQIGRAVKGRRERLVLSTKFGFTFTPDGKSMTGLDGTPVNARRVCEASLRRFQTETIDLYYLHRVDPAVPIEETVGAMADLVREGKVRHLGLSEPSIDSLRRACAVHPIAAVQSEYSLWERNVEAEVLPALRDLGIALIPFAPLGRGMLTGAFRTTAHFGSDDLRRNGVDPRFAPGNFERNLGIVDAILEVARARGATAAQIALAWLLSKGEDIVPIPGVRKIAELEENLGALTVSPLTRAEIALLEDAAPIGGTAGNRYGEAQLSQVKR